MLDGTADGNGPLLDGTADGNGPLLDGSADPSDLKARLIAFYRKHAPEKLVKVDAIVDAYATSEAELQARLFFPDVVCQRVLLAKRLGC